MVLDVATAALWRIEDGFVGAFGFRGAKRDELTRGRDAALVRGAEGSGAESAAAASRARIVETLLYLAFVAGTFTRRDSIRRFGASFTVGCLDCSVSLASSKPIFSSCFRIVSSIILSCAIESAWYFRSLLVSPSLPTSLSP